MKGRVVKRPVAAWRHPTDVDLAAAAAAVHLDAKCGRRVRLGISRFRDEHHVWTCSKCGARDRWRPRWVGGRRYDWWYMGIPECQRCGYPHVERVLCPECSAEVPDEARAAEAEDRPERG